MAIELEDYKTVYPNEVYSHPQMGVRNGNIILLDKVILLARHRPADSDTILNYLQKVAASAGQINSQNKSGWSALESAVLASSDQLRTAMMVKEKKYSDLMKSNHPQNLLEVLQLTLGFIPQYMISDADKSGKLSPAWYSRAMTSGSLSSQKLGLQLRFNLEYGESFPFDGTGKLMDKIYRAMEEEEATEDTIKYFLGEAQELVDNVSAAIPSRKELEQLTLQPPTEEMIEHTALLAFKNFIGHLKLLDKMEQQSILRKSFGGKNTGGVN